MKQLSVLIKTTLLIVVDNHKSSLALSKALLERVKNKVIIDHHRRGEEFIEAPVLNISRASVFKYCRISYRAL